MADTLIIHDLVVECRLGVYEWEQQTPQTVSIDLELEIDAARAAKRDDVREAVDYARLVESVKRLAQDAPVQLLETMAERVASVILREFQTLRVKVRVKKRALPGIGYAAVEIERPPRRSTKAGWGRAGRFRRSVRAGDRRGVRAAASRR